MNSLFTYWPLDTIPVYSSFSFIVLTGFFWIFGRIQGVSSNIITNFEEFAAAVPTLLGYFVALHNAVCEI